MSLIQPSRRTRQPAQPPLVNWANPITKGMIAACVPHLRLEAVNNGKPAPSGTLAASASNPGVGLSTNGSNSSIYFPLPLVVLTQWTIFGTFKSNSAGTDLRAMNLGGTGSNAYIPFGTGNSNAAKVRVLASDDGGGLPANQESVGSCFDGSPHTIAMTYDGSNVRCFIDGVLDTTASTSTGSVFTIDLINFGSLQRQIGNNVAFWPGAAFIGIAHKRALNAAEIWQLHLNPWQVFAAPQRRLLVEGGTATVPTGTFASTLDNATMAASGSVVDVGSFASTLGNATMAAAGSVGVLPSGTFASTLAGFTMAATGTLNDSGAFASTLQSVSMAAAGTVAPNVTGTFTTTMGDVTMSAGGFVGTPPVITGVINRRRLRPRVYPHP